MADKETKVVNEETSAKVETVTKEEYDKVVAERDTYASEYMKLANAFNKLKAEYDKLFVGSLFATSPESK